MNARMSITAGRRLKWLAPLVALMLLAGVAQPGERVKIPDGGQVLPYYARILSFPGYNMDWAAVVFYRSPESVPDDFPMNVWDVTFDWSLENNESWLTEGFLVGKKVPGSLPIATP